MPQWLYFRKIDQFGFCSALMYGCEACSGDGITILQQWPGVGYLMLMSTLTANSSLINWWGSQKYFMIPISVVSPQQMVVLDMFQWVTWGELEIQILPAS